MTRSTRQDGEPPEPARYDADTGAWLGPAAAGVSVALVDAAVVLLGETGQSGTLHLTGGSMRPNLHEDHRLLVEFSPRRLRVGDIVVFRRDDYLVVHRLVARGSGRLLTRGDAVPRLDQEPGRPLEAAGVLGRVTAFEESDGAWNLETPAARVYARLVAWHDRFWAALGRLAAGGDRLVAGIGLQARLQPIVAAVDRRLLRFFHRLLFRRVHRAVPGRDTTEPAP